MKIIIYISLLLLVFSCNKSNVGPNLQGTSNVIIKDTAGFMKGYVYAGVLNGSITGQPNSIVGTKWLLVKYTYGLATTKATDTVYFFSSTRYSVNGQGNYGYSLSQIPSSTNYNLCLYFFYPFGGSSYSGQIGYYFVTDGVINAAVFTDNQNSKIVIKAWFQKVN